MDKAKNSDYPRTKYFARCITDRESPLRILWVAAHWEKKILKCHVMKINMKKITKEIIGSNATINLRTSGHLLYGAVKIFSRKVSYLLSDCEEALTKIMFSFMTQNSIDLGKQKPGKKEKVTRKESVLFDIEALGESTCLDFDFLALANVETMMKMNVSDADSKAFQSRKEDITLREPDCTIMSTSIIQDDFGLGDELFHFLDGIRKLPTIDEVEDQLIPNISNEIERNEITFVPDTQPEDMDLASTTTTKPAKPLQPAIIETSLPPIADEDPRSGVIQILDVQPILPLEIDDNLAIVVPDPRRLKRKRLLMDYKTEITKETMKMHMDDTQCILLAGVELAPPSKKLMKMFEKGRASQLLGAPCRHLIQPKLFRLYDWSMVTMKDSNIVRKDPKKKEAVIEEMAMLVEDDAEIQRRESQKQNKKDVAVNLIEECEVNKQPDRDLQPPELLQFPPLRPESPTFPSSTPPLLTKVLTVEISSKGSKENQSPNDLLTPPCHKFNPFDPFSPVDDLPPRLQMSGTCTPPKKNSSETKTNLRSKFMRLLRQNLSESSDASVNFKAALEKLAVRNRRDVAVVFYYVLELVKENFAQVDQPSPYSDFKITRGRRFKHGGVV